MELNISEFSDNSMSSYDQIPENNAPIKVIKQQQKQQQQQQQKQQQHVPIQTVKPSLSGVKAKMVRPQTPAPKPKISYDDILGKMGMFVADGKLHLLDGKPKQQVEQITKQIVKQQPIRQQQPIQQQPLEQVNQRNSYIYNKYFNNEPSEQYDVRRPQSAYEYRDMLIRDILQRHRIKQMKSSKLIMPTSNINFAQGGSGNLNKLFTFSQR